MKVEKINYQHYILKILFSLLRKCNIQDRLNLVSSDIFSNMILLNNLNVFLQKILKRDQKNNSKHIIKMNA
jgi:hypothetical protein